MAEHHQRNLKRAAGFSIAAIIGRMTLSPITPWIPPHYRVDPAPPRGIDLLPLLCFAASLILSFPLVFDEKLRDLGPGLGFGFTRSPDGVGLLQIKHL